MVHGKSLEEVKVFKLIMCKRDEWVFHGKGEASEKNFYIHSSFSKIFLFDCRSTTSRWECYRSSTLSLFSFTRMVRLLFRHMRFCVPLLV